MPYEGNQDTTAGIIAEILNQCGWNTISFGSPWSAAAVFISAILAITYLIAVPIFLYREHSYELPIMFSVVGLFFAIAMIILFFPLLVFIISLPIMVVAYLWFATDVFLWAVRVASPYSYSAFAGLAVSLLLGRWSNHIRGAFGGNILWATLAGALGEIARALKWAAAGLGLVATVVAVLAIWPPDWAASLQSGIEREVETIIELSEALASPLNLWIITLSICTISVFAATPSVIGVWKGVKHVLSAVLAVATTVSLYTFTAAIDVQSHVDATKAHVVAIRAKTVAADWVTRAFTSAQLRDRDNLNFELNEISAAISQRCEPLTDEINLQGCKVSLAHWYATQTLQQSGRGETFSSPTVDQDVESSTTSQSSDVETGSINGGASRQESTANRWRREQDAALNTLDEADRVLVEALKSAAGVALGDSLPEPLQVFAGALVEEVANKLLKRPSVSIRDWILHGRDRESAAASVGRTVGIAEPDLADAATATEPDSLRAPAGGGIVGMLRRRGLPGPSGQGLRPASEPPDLEADPGAPRLPELPRLPKLRFPRLPRFARE
jgi:hypothetical protein